ncbi:(deoxy)nucleoside triphosphate pyrophosphohydrolase [Aestuariivivens sediminicola]|uniref:(deoxy)nucleoside triphosphate pyrophosphohydrolase n=1 Tax=Aestuariivivens sediminicola TaxID=2913560 RepID=UPI001F5A275D|nr:(deoxy)nucleoside triphosphate pyrophosphohydrolase [Aestuariivivens sediminicola]
MIKVVCGIIVDSNKIFVCRRKSGIYLGGYWEFPGGKVENGESEKDALKRELKEELEMEVNVLNYCGSSTYNYGKYNVELIGYYCSLVDYHGKLTDHDAFDWIITENLLSYKLAPADIPLAQMIVNQFIIPKNYE